MNKEFIESVDIETTDPATGKMLLSLVPPGKRFRDHPLYLDTVVETSVKLFNDLMLFKHGKDKDLADEHNLLMRVANHLLVLDGEEIEADRLEEVAGKAADFGEAFFDIEEHYPRKKGEIRDKTMDIIKSVPDYSKEAVMNQLLYAFVYVSQRAAVLPVAG